MNLCERLTSLHHLIEQIIANNSRLESSVLDDVISLLLDNQCFSSPDCLVRRLALALCETVCLRMIVNAACGQEAAVLSKYGEFAHKVLATLSCLSPLLRKLPCSGKHWFGGHTSSKLDSAQSDPYFSSMILCAAVSSLTSASDKGEFDLVECTLKMAETCFSSSNSVVKYLINNDEGCLAVILALLILKDEKFNLPDVLNPLKLFVELLNAIQFDHQVMIDWLFSESIAIICLLRFVKFFAGHFAEFAAACKEVSTVKCKRARLSGTVVLPCASGNRDRLSITITEMVGSQERQREIQLCLAATSKNRSGIPLNSEDGTETGNVDYLDGSLDCLIRLRLKLERLSSANLAKFNVAPLIRAVERLESIAEQDATQNGMHRCRHGHRGWGIFPPRGLSTKMKKWLGGRNGKNENVFLT